MEATTRRALTLATRRHASFVVLSFSLAAFGCGSSSGGDPDPTPTPTGCTSDAQCGAAEYCELAGSSSAALLDPPCFFACLDAEMCMTPSCENACAESCGATCPEFCDFVCGGGAGAPPDPLCVADCVPRCEADRMSTPPPPPPPPPPADAGTTPPPPPPPSDAGTSSPPMREGVCRARPTPPPSDAGTPLPTDSGTPPTEDAGTTPTPIAWAGTWNVRAAFTARCMWSSAGAPRDTALDYTVTARLTGANDDLTAVISTDYEMTGTGSDSGLTLSGQFPGRDHNDNAATTVRRDNQVSIRVREVIGANEARGTIEGNYETSGGVSCVIQDGGTVTFER